MCSSANLSIVFDDRVLGINLRAVRGGKGAFLESFYRGKDGTKLQAESSETLDYGDQIVAIRGSNVYTQSATYISDLLSSSNKPLTVEFRRHPPMETVQGLLFDPRLSAWLHDFLAQRFGQEEQRGKVLDKISLLNLVELLLDPTASAEPNEVTGGLALECVVFCIEQYQIDAVPDGLRDGVALLVSSAHPSGAQVTACLGAAQQLLHSDLTFLLSPFLATPAAKQLVAWMAFSPPYRRFSIAEILDDQVLATGYYLFLCYSGRQRSVFLYLRGRKTGEECTPGHANRRKVVAAEAVRDGLLLAFYASSIYEAILAELWHELQESNGQSWRAGALQRIMRASSAPPGISLHRRQVPGPPPPAGDDKQSFQIVRFDSLAPGSIPAEGGWTAPQPLRCLNVVSVNHLSAEDMDAASASAALLSFLVPGLLYPRSAPRLLSFVVPCSDSRLLYGASLAFCTEDTCSIEGSVAEEGDNVAEHPADRAGTECVGGTASPAQLGCAFSPTASPRHPPPVVRSPVPPSPVPPPAAGRASSDWLGSVLNEAETKRRALQTTLTSQAGSFVTGIRQWGDHRLPQLASTLMTASSGAGAQGNTAVVCSPPGRPLLSPLLRAVGLKPPPPMSPAERIASPPRYQLRPRREEAVVNNGDQLCALAITHGVAVLSDTPAITFLRCALEAAYTGDGSSLLQELDTVVATLRDRQAGVDLLRSLHREAPPHSAADTAWDFNPQLLYEILSPAALTTIFLAFLVECKILIVSDTQQSAALYLGEWLRQAISPLAWCHVYNPVAPQAMALDLLQCPVPYFLGMLRSADLAAASVPADVLVVDLDDGSLRMPRALDRALPAAQKLCDQLGAAMRPNFFRCDQMGRAKEGLLDAGGAVMPCRAFVAALLQPVERCCLELERSEERLLALDEQRFLGKAQRSVVSAGYADSAAEKDAAAELVRLLMRAQCFSEYILSTCYLATCK